MKLLSAHSKTNFLFHPIKFCKRKKKGWRAEAQSFSFCFFKKTPLGRKRVELNEKIYLSATCSTPQTQMSIKSELGIRFSIDKTYFLTEATNKCTQMYMKLNWKGKIRLWGLWGKGKHWIIKAWVSTIPKRNEQVGRFVNDVRINMCSWWSRSWY